MDGACVQLIPSSAVGIQRELLPRLSAEVTYNRRWFGNFTATDNVLVGPSDYSPYSIVAPLDPRLPDGGGYTIDDLWDINPTKFGQVGRLRRPRGGLRESNQLLARRGRQHQRPHAEQPDVSRRHEHRACGDRHLRRDAEARFAQSAFLPCGRAVRHAVQGAGVVHHPEGGCPGEFHDPEPARRESGGEPGRAERHGGANTGPAAGRRRQQRDGEPHRTADALRRPHQPGRFPCRQASAIRTHAGCRLASTSST